MGKTADEFLKSWRSSYIYAEARDLESLNETVAECVDDAAREGYTRDQLEKAAGGNLVMYIREAIIKISGE